MKHELFVWYPRRFVQAHDEKAITFEQFALGMFLRAAADYRTDTLTITVTEIKARMHRSRRSDDSIRRDLHALKAGRWIDFDIQARQRDPWEIRLTGLLVREVDDASAANSGTTAANGQPHETATAHGERDGGAAELPHADFAPSTSTSLRVGEDFLGGENRESGAASFSEETACADVRKFAERGRALRAEQEADEAVGEQEFVRLLFEQFPGSYWADDTNRRPGAVRGAVHDGEEDA